MATGAWLRASSSSAEKTTLGGWVAVGWVTVISVVVELWLAHCYTLPGRQLRGSQCAGV